MSQINQYQGMLSDILIERGASIIAETTTLMSGGGAVTRILINSYTGPLMPKGSTIQVKPKYTNDVAVYRLTGDLNTGDTAIDVVSKTNTFDIPAKTNIFYNGLNQIQYQYKRFFVEHIHMFETGTTHGNDLLINSQEPGGGKYNHNSGANLTSGSNYSNNWGTKFSVLNVPSFKCKLERIIYSCSSNGTTNEDWTISLWKKPINANSSSASAITLINAEEIISQNNASYVTYIERFSDEMDIADTSLDAQTAIIPSFKKSGSKQTSSTKHYADITLIFSYYDA
jgi:hypothetical protein|tara:strand:- start:1086 stop:1937 length:852 start_codon:yes stop_codon:yes gene_type:complete